MDETIELLEKEKELNEREQRLLKRENEVSDLEGIKKKLEDNYSSKNRELNTLRQNILTEKIKEISDKNAELKKINEEIAKISLELISKREELAKSKATIKLECSEYKAKQLKEIESELLNQFESKIKKIEEDYAAYLASTTDVVSWSESKLHKAFDDITNEYKAMLESKEKLVQQQIDDLEAAKKQYDAALEQNSHIKETEVILDLRKKELELKQKMFEGIIDKEVQKKYSSLSAENERLNNQYADTLNELNNLKNEYRKLQNDITSAEAISKLELETENTRLAKLNEDLIRKFGQYSTSDFENLKDKASRFDTIEKENNKIRLELIDLQNKIDILTHEKDESDHLKYENEQLQNRNRVERLLSLELKKQIDELASRVDNVKSAVIASETIETPYPDFLHCSTNDNPIDEQTWINNIITKCQDSGYKFSRRLFYSFHTSLKTSDMSPLTVLAGVSGTGKSKLPQLYSRFGGLYFLSIPVQQDWDSPQSLFGYFNSIEKRFNATSLLRALVSFQYDKSKSKTRDNILDLSDRVLIVLLDEMNLAHVELYFSDLLSKLEERRGENKDVGFEVDLGAGNDKYPIILTDNVKWVGTMNEDETTKSLSDKVIDRGNVISFPRPDKFERYNTKQLEPEEEKINKKVWNFWVQSKVTLREEEVNTFMDIIVKINNALKKVNRALGHRVWQSIENYMMSHPLVAEFENDEKRMTALKYAFEEALVHKVMPKLRGIDTTGFQRTECLDVIRKVLEEAELKTILSDYDNAMSSVTETFIWDSANYLSSEYNMEE